MEFSVRRLTCVGMAIGVVALSAGKVQAQLLDRLRGQTQAPTRVEEPGGRYYVYPDQGDRTYPSREGRVYRGGTEYRGSTEYRDDGEFRSGERIQTRSASRARRGTTLIGSTVRLEGNRTMGRVDDIVIGESGCIDFMIVSVSGMRGLTGKVAALPFAAGDVDFARRTVYLDWAEEDLRRAPIFFSSTAWPDFSEPNWTRDVFAYFEVDSHDEHSGRAYREPRQSDRDRSDERSSRSRDNDRDDNRSYRGQDSRSRDSSTRDRDSYDQERGRSDYRSRSREDDEDRSGDRSNRSSDSRDRSSNRNRSDRSNSDDDSNNDDSNSNSKSSSSDRSRNSNRNDQPE